MGEWILIIAIAGALGVADVKTVRMTEPQCKAAADALSPLSGKVGVECVGPYGERYRGEK